MATTLFDYSPGALSTIATYTTTWRYVIPAASLTPGSFARLRLKLLYVSNYTVRIYVGLRATSGDAFDIDPATMVQLAKGGSTAISVTGTGQYTDWVTLLIDGTRDLVISHYGVSGAIPRFDTALSGKYRKYTRPYDWNLPADGTGFAAYGTLVYTVSAIEGDVGYVKVPVATLEQRWGFFEDSLRADLVQEWHVMDDRLRADLTQPWGIKMGVDLLQSWTDAPVIKAMLSQPWGNASVLRAELRQRWDSSFTLRATLEQGWHVFGVVQAELAQRWAITADLVRGVLEQGWDLRERDLLRAELLQRWAIEADGAVLRYTVAVEIEGVAVGISHLNIEGGIDQDVLSCELHLGSEGDYLRCRMGSEVAVSITSAAGTEHFAFVVTAPRITEEHGNTQYIVEAMSPALLLGEPYANPIEGELSGLASAIAATLAGSVPLSWQTVGWEIPPSTWIAAGETPLALLKTLAAAVGAVVQSLPDGSLVIMPEWPVSINQLGSVAPALTLVENLDCLTTGSTPELKSGYNRFLIGDQLTTANTLRLDEESISDTVKIVRGYQTPWTGEFDLAHTGGDWVVIEPLGVEERQETETIEIVAGAGRAQYPIYSRDLVEWGQVNLGSVTVAEDGSVQAAVAEESLLTITYTTRCKKWQVRNPRNEQLQLVVPA